MNLLQLFTNCLNANYKTVENQGDYAIQYDGSHLYLYFEWSDGQEDWKNNLDFPAKPYKDMGTTWYCHRGFLKVWKSIEPYVANAIADTKVTAITVVGYSHGGAIATLCHEYVWYNRPDLRDKLEGYGFGAPRVFWGCLKDELKHRWDNFHIIRNLNDGVTYLPPAVFGFRHVNTIDKIGTKGEFAVKSKLPKCLDAHRPENYILSLSK